jgi:hypothetical protein|mmetsp:Transcript_31244/g.56623  ORF Transcript_31244/g.56623 Transcript_31244/m.56623 type:complete len:212 (-) Transcript_31244:172-807(-)
MAKLSLAALAALVASTAAFAPTQNAGRVQTAMKASAEIWDPMGLYELGEGKAFDTFPNMFPSKQYLDESEIKHGRQAMLAWTGIWATHEGGLGLGLKFPGMPDADWTTALGAFAKEQPVLFGVIFTLFCIGEGEGISHNGDSWRGKGKKEVAGDMNYDPLGLKQKFSAEKMERMKEVEIKNGRAAMIAMASMFAFEALPGSVPIMDLLGAS